METVLIVPIGGLVAALGILAIIGIIWLFSAATENVDTISQFANQNTDSVVLVVGGICFAIALLIAIAFHNGTNKYKLDREKTPFISRLFPILVRALIMTLPYTLGISVVYAWCMQMMDAIVDIIAESVLMWISVPLVVIFALFGAVVGLVPMGVLFWFECEGTDGVETWKDFYLLGIFEGIAFVIYIILMFTCTDLPEYLYNSFAVW